MADRTESTDKLTRSELATYLAALGEEFERGDDEVSIAVGNKTVSLNPPEEITTDVEVTERSSVLRGSQEKVQIELRWKS